jgi:D-psicose/D-tagatose/L-ribulose 3-epimerase
MKLGINLYLWTDHMHDGLLQVLESLKRIGYDGVEVPIFDLNEAKRARWGNSWMISARSGRPTL